MILLGPQGGLDSFTGFICMLPLLKAVGSAFPFQASRGVMTDPRLRAGISSNCRGTRRYPISFYSYQHCRIAPTLAEPRFRAEQAGCRKAPGGGNVGAQVLTSWLMELRTNTNTTNFAGVISPCQ